MKRFNKPMWLAISVVILATFSLRAQATYIFKFDNATVPEVDFVGIEASDFYLSFGQDDLDIGDTFDILIGATAGGSELVEALDMFTNSDDIMGIGFGDVLDLVPVTEQFFVTVVEKTGSFTVDTVRIYFSNNGVGSVFEGVLQRAPAVDVPEPSSLLLLLSTFGLMWLMRCKRYLSQPPVRRIRSAT